MATLVEDEVYEHVGDIMTDSLASPDPDCSICKRGIELGAWAQWGVDDPFAPDEGGDDGGTE